MGMGSSQAMVSMLLVQIFATGMQLLSRVVLAKDTFVFALIAYRHVIATLCVVPFALYFERGQPKNFSLSAWLWLFLNALFGIVMAMGFFYYGLRDTSATYAVNFLNLIPIFTFIFSIICRIEKLGLKTLAGKAKIIGAIACVGGALTTGLYTGKQFYIGHHHHQHSTSAVSHKTNMLRGTIFLVASCLSYTTWYIVQVRLKKVFPLNYWTTMLTCAIGTIQSVLVGLCIDHSKASWTLGWDMQLLTIVYSGVLGTAATFCLVSWAISMKGPTYPPMFNPLVLIFVAVLEAILLGESLSVGKVTGMVLIIFGIYLFLWGKKKEIQSLSQPNGAMDKVSKDIVVESSELQSTTLAMPCSSTTTTIIDIEEPTSKKELES